MILYHGPSVLDGQPIMAIATSNSSNRKTGNLIQVWILRADVAPHDAVKSGADVSICGQCPKRHYNGGDCYVLPFQAPLSIYRAFHRGSYARAEPDNFTGADVRIGAYGDPAAVPAHIWEYFMQGASNVLGYTHQISHKQFDPAIARFCQISADTPKQATRAHEQGYKTFRVCGDDSKRLDNEIVCPASDAISCADCLMCDGQTANMVIEAHGARSARTKQIDIRLASS